MSPAILEMVEINAMEVLGKLNPKYTFHSQFHTQEVVAFSKLIGKKCKLTAMEQQVVLIAAWYHDTGYIRSPHNHEDHSVVIAENFLKTNYYSSHNLRKVISCIRATKFPQRPSNLLEAVLCDADMMHLSNEQYWSKNILLCKELEFINQSKIRNDQWCCENLNFLTQHCYHTSFGKNVLNKQKMKHLDENVRRLESLKAV
jgi:predicted metal-dependent HD superfamily phosphohydrolase